MLIPCTASALQAKDLLSLVAMPLAVAAVSDVTGVPQRDLADITAALNQANVPPQQFVEVVRYLPVALTNDTTAPQFVQFVTSEADRGGSSEAFLQSIAERLRTYGATEIDVVAPRFEPITIAEQPVVIHEQPIVVQQPVVVREPVVVRHQPVVEHHRRVVVQRQPVVVQQEVHVEHGHPHGGPPGQLKKVVGVQTGAEIVHGNGGGPGNGHGNGRGNGNGHGKGKH